MVSLTEPGGCCFNVGFYRREGRINGPDLWSATGRRERKLFVMAAESLARAE